MAQSATSSLFVLSHFLNNDFSDDVLPLDDDSNVLVTDLYGLYLYFCTVLATEIRPPSGALGALAIRTIRDARGIGFQLPTM